MGGGVDYLYIYQSKADPELQAGNLMAISLIFIPFKYCSGCFILSSVSLWVAWSECGDFCYWIYWTSWMEFLAWWFFVELCNLLYVLTWEYFGVVTVLFYLPLFNSFCVFYYSIFFLQISLLIIYALIWIFLLVYFGIIWDKLYGFREDF